jgi:pimeloyl-ACP methyl ester carboxylesterase
VVADWVRLAGPGDRHQPLPALPRNVDGVGLHFLHLRGRGPAPLPLLLTHGWPSSFLELLPLVPLLTDPSTYGGDAGDAFDLMIPSLPGYGLSDPLPDRGASARTRGCGCG